MSQDKPSEQAVAQLRETFWSLRAAGLSVADAIATVYPMMCASAEAAAQFLPPGVVSSEDEKRLKP